MTTTTIDEQRTSRGRSLLLQLHADQHTADTLANRPRLIAPRSHAADPARIRGIPAIGPNCPGAMKHTRPDHVILNQRTRNNT